MMSDQEKKSGGSGGSIVMVEKTASSRHTPYRPIELQEDTSDLHNRSHKVPAVPSLVAELKVTTINVVSASDEREHAMTSERHKFEDIAMADIQSRKDTVTASKLPIPPQLEDLKSSSKADENNIIEEITELRPSEAVKGLSEWSDDEEAGGLPRSESRGSRGSRVSRAVRQLFCCGVAYHAPSEEEIPPRQYSGI